MIQLICNSQDFSGDSNLKLQNDDLWLYSRIGFERRLLDAYAAFRTAGGSLGA